MTYRVQPSYGLGWDIWPDQTDLPARFPNFISFGKRLSQEPHPRHIVFLHYCRNLDDYSLVYLNCWGLLDHVSVWDLILHYSSTGIANYVIENTSIYPFSSLVVDSRDSVLNGSLK